MPHYPISTTLPNNHTPSIPHYPINTTLPNNHTPIYATLPYQYHTPIYATLPYQYQTAQQPYPHLCHTTLSIPDCSTTIPSSMPHYPINTRLLNNHTPIYATLPYQYQTAQQPYHHLCHTTLSIPDCPTTIPPSMPHYPINTRLPNNHTPIYARLPYQYQTAQQPYPHLCNTTLSIPDCPTTIPPSMPHYPINTRLPNNHTPIYATLPYQYQTAQPPYPIYATLPYQYHTAKQPYPHLCHTTLSIPYCPITIPPSMPHYPINTRLPNKHTPSMLHYPINTRLPNNYMYTLIYATLPYQYQTARQPYPHLCHTTLSIPDCPITIPHLYHTTLSIPDCPITIPLSMPHYPINTRLPNNHTPSMPHYPINTILPNNHTPIYATLPYQYQTAQQPYPHLCHTTLSIPYCPTTIPPSMPHCPINTILPNNHTLIYTTLPYQYQTAQQPYPHLCHTTLSIPYCPTTIPPSMPHYPINTILPNNHTPIYATLPYQYQTAQ